MGGNILKSLILYWTFTAFLHQCIDIGAFTDHKKVNVNKFASNWTHGWYCIKLDLVTISVYYLSVEGDLPVDVLGLLQPKHRERSIEGSFSILSQFSFIICLSQTLPSLGSFISSPVYFQKNHARITIHWDSFFLFHFGAINSRDCRRFSSIQRIPLSSSSFCLFILSSLSLIFEFPLFISPPFSLSFFILSLFLIFFLRFHPFLVFNSIQKHRNSIIFSPTFFFSRSQAFLTSLDIQMMQPLLFVGFPWVDAQITMIMIDDRW